VVVRGEQRETAHLSRQMLQHRVRNRVPAYAARAHEYTRQ
jgi:hypothetical protein